MPANNPSQHKIVRFLTLVITVLFLLIIAAGLVWVLLQIVRAI